MRLEVPERRVTRPRTNPRRHRRTDLRQIRRAQRNHHPSPPCEVSSTGRAKPALVAAVTGVGRAKLATRQFGVKAGERGRPKCGSNPAVMGWTMPPSAYARSHLTVLACNM